MNVKEFVIDYCDRHKHPLNACLHIVGVPAAFAGFYFLFAGKFLLALELIVGGYFLQYLGHRAQGNEVGEVTLIKHVLRKLAKRNGVKS
ncbi:MAG TPA: Mpo1-like protein [Candidatus Obscuribacterales bacterium]